MNRLYKQPDEQKNSLTRGGRGYNKTLQVRRLEFAGVWTSHISLHAGTYGGQCSEQHDIALCGAGGITHDEQQDFRPVRFGERGQWLVRVTPVLQFFGFVRFFIVHLIIYMRVCEIFGRCISCIFAFFRWFITPSLQRVTPALSARWNAVPRWTSPCRVVSALENIRSACSRSYLADTRHNRWKNSRPASPQSVAMANASCTYSAYVGAISAPAVSTASQRRHNDSISVIILIFDL